jgi:hypothetical protein
MYLKEHPSTCDTCEGYGAIVRPDLTYYCTELTCRDCEGSGKNYDAMWSYPEAEDWEEGFCCVCKRERPETMLPEFCGTVCKDCLIKEHAKLCGCKLWKVAENMYANA